MEKRLRRTKYFFRFSLVSLLLFCFIGWWIHFADTHLSQAASNEQVLLSYHIEIHSSTALNNLPQEPNWTDISALDILEQSKGNYELLPKENVKISNDGTISLHNNFGKLLTFIQETDTFFRNDDKLVHISQGETVSKVSRTLYDLSKPSVINFKLADNTPFFYLSENGLYYYVNSNGIKGCQKVANINNIEYSYVGTTKSINGVRYPIFKKGASTDLYIFYLENATQICEDPYFYTILTPNLLSE